MSVRVQRLLDRLVDTPVAAYDATWTLRLANAPYDALLGETSTWRGSRATPSGATSSVRVRPHDLPGVAVEVGEAAGVHEAVVLGGVHLRGARGVGDRVDLDAGGNAEAVERLRVRGGIARRQVRMLRDLGFTSHELHETGRTEVAERFAARDK